MVDSAGNPATLRDLLVAAERQTRQLADHLEKVVLSKVQSLAKVVESADPDSPRAAAIDAALRTEAAHVLATEESTRQLYEELQSNLVLIEEAATALAHQRR